MLKELRLSKAMRILLVNPGFRGYRGLDLFPLALGYLTSFLEGHEVKILDLQVEEEDKLIELVKSVDLVGITSTTPSFESARQIAQIAKREGKIVVMGGAHVTFRPTDALDVCDYVVLGEGELTFSELCKTLEEGGDIEKVRGIAFKSGDEVIRTEEMPLIEDLDSIPFPHYELFPMEKYKIMSVTTSRGCIFNCIYCAARKFWRGRVRFRSVKNVVEELKMLVERFGKRNFKFHDSTFTLDMQRAKKLCEAIKELGISWSCETRAELLDESLIATMAEAGCKLMCFGIDSGDESVLERANRYVDFDACAESFRLCRKYGIRTRAYIIFGLPGENEASCKRTIELIERLKPDEVMLSLACAYPGTELRPSEVIPHESWIAKFMGHGRGAPLHVPEGMDIKTYMRLADHMWQWAREYNKRSRSRRQLYP